MTMTSGFQPRDSVFSLHGRADTRARLKEDHAFLSALGRFFLHGGKRQRMNFPVSEIFLSGYLTASSVVFLCLPYQVKQLIFAL